MENEIKLGELCKSFFKKYKGFFRKYLGFILLNPLITYSGKGTYNNYVDRILHFLTPESGQKQFF